MNTMDNLGYAYTMSRAYNKAAEVSRLIDASIATTTKHSLTYPIVRTFFLQIYSELMTAQEKGNAGDKARTSTLRKIVYVQLTLRDHENALETLRELESIELDLYGTDSRQWKETNRLMGQVNYEVLKHPTIPSFACFSCGSDSLSEMNLYSWVPKKPTNGSKMSGHRVTYA